MAHFSTHSSATSPILHSIWQSLSAIGGAFLSMGTATAKARQVEALMALSDEELADRGLRRDQIARFVFSDSFWV